MPVGEFAVKPDVEEGRDEERVNGYILRFADHWSVPMVEIKIGQPKSTTIVLADAGRQSLAEEVAKLLAQGERVIAVDPWYFGECALGKQDFLMGLVLSTVGDRPLGLQVAQLNDVMEWAAQAKHPVRLESFGPRTSLTALCAAAISSGVHEVVTHDGLASLKDVLHQNKAVNEGPDLFTFGLLEFTDIAQLKAACDRPAR